MKKKNIITRVLALSLCVIMLAFSLASCTAGEKIKTGASDAWGKVKDGAEDIYNSVTDKSTGDIELDPISNAHIRLASLETSTVSKDESYKKTLKAVNFANCPTYKNAAGATYVMYEPRVGSITAVTGAVQGDYWTATAGDKPVVAVDGNMSRVCVVLPTGYTSVASWAATATDFSVSVTPVMEKELVATVLPESATNKAVEWSVSVKTNPDGAEIDPADYIRILTFEGLWENRVQVLALAPFPGIEFKITCTTVVGGYAADCTVKYVGEPSALNFYTENTDGSRNYITGQTNFEAGNTYQIKLELGNVFDAVGDKYGTYEVVSVSGSGSIVCGVYTTNGDSDTTKTSELTVNMSDSTVIPTMFGATISGDTLTLEAKMAPKGYKRYVTRGYIQYQSGGDDCIFSVTIRDTVSKLERTLSFTIENIVTSIYLNQTVVEF